METNAKIDKMRIGKEGYSSLTLRYKVFFLDNEDLSAPCRRGSRISQKKSKAANHSEKHKMHRKYEVEGCARNELQQQKYLEEMNERRDTSTKVIQHPSKFSVTPLMELHVCGIRHGCEQLADTIRRD